MVAHHNLQHLYRAAALDVIGGKTIAIIYIPSVTFVSSTVIIEMQSSSLDVNCRCNTVTIPVQVIRRLTSGHLSAAADSKTSPASNSSAAVNHADGWYYGLKYIPWLYFRQVYVIQKHSMWLVSFVPTPAFVACNTNAGKGLVKRSHVQWRTCMHCKNEGVNFTP